MSKPTQRQAAERAATRLEAFARLAERVRIAKMLRDRGHLELATELAVSAEREALLELERDGSTEEVAADAER